MVSESVFTVSKVHYCDETEGDRATVQTTTNTDNTSSLEEAQDDRTTGQSIILVLTLPRHAFITQN